MAFKKGHIVSDNCKRRSSEVHKGKPSGSAGKHWKLSEETKKKMRKPKSDATKEKFRKFQTGQKRSIEQRLNMSGENCHFWKGGITPENIKIRMGIEFRLWRESVFARDNYTCQKCSQKGGKLNPHHIFNFSTYLDLRFAIDNGITLCKECHREFHKKYGYRNNTREQLEKFFQLN